MVLVLYQKHTGNGGYNLSYTIESLSKKDLICKSSLLAPLTKAVLKAKDVQK
jgi:hypothetical protein